MRDFKDSSISFCVKHKLHLTSKWRRVGALQDLWQTWEGARPVKLDPPQGLVLPCLQIRTKRYLVKALGPHRAGIGQNPLVNLPETP